MARQRAEPAFDKTNGYVRYQPDPDSDRFVYSQSSYGDYGNAAKGPYFDEASGRCITAAAAKTAPSQRHRLDPDSALASGTTDAGS